jgi:gliding motility-associated lipoprotein GldJ
MILIREGILEPDPNQMNESNFNTDAYYVGQGEGLRLGKQQMRDFRTKKGTRQVRMEDGIMLPDYRLPTEAEWEYAAQANIGAATYENVNQKKIYSWEGLTVRHFGDKESTRGLFNANVMRGRGDNAGISNRLNDEGFITLPVGTYWPNDHGLFNMSGNVSEWVMDVYRPMSYEDVSEFNSFRGNFYTKKQLDEDGIVDLKDSLGRLIYIPVTEEENVGRRNYKRADNRGYLDEEDYMDGEQGYEYGVTTLIDNKARVYKGGSWKDRIYWASPGTRRWLDEEQSTSYIGFRCAMHKVGGPD